MRQSLPQLAALQDEENGHFGSAALTEGRLYLPSSVELADDYVVWRYDTLGSTGRSAGMLDAMVALTSPADVEKFVGRFGPLNFCLRHRLPVGHNAIPQNPAVDDSLVWQTSAGRSFDVIAPDDLEFPSRFCLVDRVPGRWDHREPVSAYLKLARQLRAGLRIADGLKTAELSSLGWASIGSEDDWLDYTLGFRGRPFSGEHKGEPIDTSVAPAATDLFLARRVFCTHLNVLVGYGRVRPTVLWNALRGPEFTLDGDQFGLLVVQLIHAVSGTHSVCVCSACERPYLRRERKPAGDRRNYCPLCKAAAPRDAKRAQRMREKAQRDG